jgi:hypothetical protein
MRRQMHKSHIGRRDMDAVAFDQLAASSIF